MKKDWESDFLTNLADIQTGKWDSNHALKDGKYRFYTCAYVHLYSDTKIFKVEVVKAKRNIIRLLSLSFRIIMFYFLFDKSIKIFRKNKI